jgi:ABC-type sugar transport system ATPase subunit
MIYVTHDQVEAMTMGDKIAVLAPIRDAARSNLMQFGSPEEVYDRPQNLFVAKFIGSPQMNIFTLETSGDSFALGRIRLAVKSNAALPSKILVGVRPEHLTLENPSMPVTFSARVEVTENLGHERLIFLTSPIGNLTVRTSDRTRPFRPADSVMVGLSPDRLHIFDAKTETRVQGAECSVATLPDVEGTLKLA